MDRLFLDANILVSAAHEGPVVAKLWQAARRGEVRLLTSAYALDKARRNLDPPQQSRLAFLASHMTIVPESAGSPPFTVDLPAEDRPIVVAAAYASATRLITGDRRHFGKLYGSTIEGVLICSLRQYLTGPSESA